MDFFFAGVTGGGGSGTLWDCGSGGGGRSAEVGIPVGPVCLGKTTVGAEDEDAIVAFESRSSLLVGLP